MVGRTIGARLADDRTSVPLEAPVQAARTRPERQPGRAPAEADGLGTGVAGGRWLTMIPSSMAGGSSRRCHIPRS